MTFDDDKVPSTVDEAIDMMVAAMEPAEREAFAALDGADVHHGFGTNVRNTWSLWEQDTPLQRDFIKRFGLFGHADDISAIIIASARAKLVGGDVLAEQQRLTNRFKRHWASMGLDPLTGERVRDMPNVWRLHIDPKTGEVIPDKA